jgi:hypothetical protein
MASSKTDRAAKRAAKQQQKGLEADEGREPVQAPDEPAVPREGLEDESQERSRERDGEESRPAPGSDDDPARDKRDESQERSEEVDRLIEGGEAMQPDRTVVDGGLEGEDLPVVRVGEVYEDVRPSRDDHRRYVKIIDAARMSMAACW